MRAPIVGLMLLSVAAAACGREGRRAGADSQAAPPADSVAPPREPLPSVGAADSTATAPAAPAPTSAPARPSVTPRPAPGTGVAAPTPARGDSAHGAEDSTVVARGTVRLTGSRPMLRLVLLQPDGGSVVLSGPERTALGRVGGTEVEARGRMRNGELQVTSFVVLSASGEPALDGMIERDGDTIYIRTAQGRIRLGNPPDELRKMTGARVWITGSPETGPNRYGVIVPVG